MAGGLCVCGGDKAPLSIINNLNGRLRCLRMTAIVVGNKVGKIGLGAVFGINRFRWLKLDREWEAHRNGLTGADKLRYKLG